MVPSRHDVGRRDMPARTPCGMRSPAALRAPQETAHGELDTLSTLLYCSAQFAPDRPQS
ncbi:hypothetical protein FOC30_10580 [Burkholderia multivorans]|nr:hypothetical protein FOC30_10580 [Burkholderia multivorans]